MPSFIASVNNAFDFARTAVLLYGEGNPSVVHAAHLLFEEDTIDLAMGKCFLISCQLIESELKKTEKSSEVGRCRGHGYL